MSLALGIGRLQLGNKTLFEQALSILRRPGITANVYLPGIGTISGLQAANFLLSDGSTGLTTVDGVTGLVLDAMGSETQLFNAVGVTTAGPSLTGLNASLNTTAGKSYRVTYTVTALVGQLSSAAGGTSGLAQAINWTGTYSETLVAVTTGATNCGLITRGIGVTSVTGSVTVTEVTGIHATQPTTAAKPRLERGVRNLLTYSQDFTNAAWIKTNSTINTGLADPYGGTSAFKIVETSATGAHGIAPIYTTPQGAYTFAAIVSAKERTNSVLTITDYATGDASIRIDLTTGVLSATSLSVGAWTGVASSVVSLGAGWFLVCVSGTSHAGTSLGGSIYTADNSGNVSYAGDTSKGVSAYRAGLFQGTLTAAQILAEGGIPLTTTAAASNPSAGKYSWAFDGGDSLSLGSVPFQMSDDFAIIAGARADVISTSPDVFSQASTASANPVIKLGFDASGKPQFACRDDAGTLDLLTDPGASRQFTTCTLSCRKVGNAKTLRVNGGQVATANIALGATTFTGASIGARSTSVLANYLTGSTGLIIDIKGTLTDSEMLTLERLVSNLTPNAPVF